MAFGPNTMLVGYFLAHLHITCSLFGGYYYPTAHEDKDKNTS